MVGLETRKKLPPHVRLGNLRGVCVALLHFALRLSGRIERLNYLSGTTQQTSSDTTRKEDLKKTACGQQQTVKPSL